MGFIAVGWTGGLSSRRFIGRYKSPEELRDVFRLRRLTSATSRRLYIFEECPPTERCLWLLSFDIKLVKVRRSEGGVERYRRPSHEYSILKEMLHSRLCGSVDLSTYICFNDESSMVEDYLGAVAPGHYRLEVHRVRPYDDRTWSLVREAVEGAVEDLTGRAHRQTSKLRSARPGNRKKVRDRALELLEALRSAVKIAGARRDVIEKLGLAGIESELAGALEHLEEALRSGGEHDR